MGCASNHGLGELQTTRVMVGGLGTFFFFNFFFPALKSWAVWGNRF